MSAAFFGSCQQSAAPPRYASMAPYAALRRNYFPVCSVFVSGIQ
jgi:hypothetical protein